MAEPLAYLRDGAAIYERSFAIIRAEADLAAFSPPEADIVVRMIHACGLVEAAQHIVFGGDPVGAARRALGAGAPILCDAEMVAHGVTRARLPARNEVLCMLHDARVPALAQRLATTRSAAALELWSQRLGGAVVAIGNAPTALFRLSRCSPAGPPSRPPSSGFRSGSWARRNPRRRSRPIRTACRSWWCAAAWAAAPWRRPPSMPWRGPAYERGRLIGVGVGPGDPELMTLKAARALAQADLVVHFAKAGASSHARTIAAGTCGPAHRNCRCSIR